MLRKLYVCVAAISAAIALDGCAIIVSGPSQPIKVSTAPEAGADCTLTNPRGQWHVVSPGEVRVLRSKYDMKITCTKDGWSSEPGTIPSKFNGWVLGNVLIGGIVGIIIDASNGASSKYPQTYDMKLTPLATTTEAALPKETALPK